MKLKITAKELRNMGYPNEPVIPIAMDVMHKAYKHSSQEDAIQLLQAILAQPAQYLAHEYLGKIAERLTNEIPESQMEISLNKEGVPFNTFGMQHIEQSALHQMYQASKLPISVAGALMPDAHHGYGLPIGGVLATRNAVIPYGVGMDIGCRMCLSILPITPETLISKRDDFEKILLTHTLFGGSAQFAQASSHAVLDSTLFQEIKFLKHLQGKAWKQLGSSGSGNHFVEFGIVKITEHDAALNVAPGNYVGLLSHSGSRALGAYIAQHYTLLAKQKRRMPQDVNHFAWLHLNEEEGQEYWLAMNLAGDYAAACHEIIHQKIKKALHVQALATVENHHNFAWKEMLDGEEVIVHRKGATPAGKDVLGIIPGSMTAPGFIVKGKGNEASVNSASHGAGRKLSRTKASNSITPSAMRDELKKHGVKLLGGATDEAPFAYKDIHEVMRAQSDLVSIVGQFNPKIVRMASK
jgi:tRNA-splicing ligase RtcB (3'-phosphate/5'-hydroxy nucleic acid ligase)